MKGMMREELSRAFKNGRWGIIALLAALSFVYGFNQVTLIQQGMPLNALMSWQLIMQRGSYGFFAALMAGLPFADSLLQDSRHHYLNQVLMRSRYGQYLTAKLLATLVSGIAAVVIPGLILLAICVLVFPGDPHFSFEMPVGVFGQSSPTVIEPDSVLKFSGTLYAAVGLLMLSLFGAIYALVGLGSSFVIKNLFVVLGTPFVLYSLGFFIFPISARLSWLSSTEAALLLSGGLISPAVQYLSLICLFIGVLLFAGKKDRILGN